MWPVQFRAQKLGLFQCPKPSIYLVYTDEPCMLWFRWFHSVMNLILQSVY